MCHPPWGFSTLYIKTSKIHSKQSKTWVSVNNCLNQVAEGFWQGPDITWALQATEALRQLVSPRQSHQTGRTPHTKEHRCVPAALPLSTPKQESHTVFKCHRIVLFLKKFSNYLKMWKPFQACGPYKEQAAGWIWPLAVCSWLTPGGEGGGCRWKRV